MMVDQPPQAGLGFYQYGTTPSRTLELNVCESAGTLPGSNSILGMGSLLLQRQAAYEPTSNAFDLPADMVNVKNFRGDYHCPEATLSVLDPSDGLAELDLPSSAPWGLIEPQTVSDANVPDPMNVNADRSGQASHPGSAHGTTQKTYRSPVSANLSVLWQPISTSLPQY